ncbi:MAG TPA: 3' terminal RNA ribose 2'-O-methyltransferase Hen1 [Caulobacter sp.]|nr:3' terminal RNA ribose 2'-O-methyltransferase Hen1 [Caulobacter sp.]
MYLSLATTHRPATDLGYLLHKHPGRAHEMELAFGKAHLVYPEASDERCEAALILDVDPVGLVRGKGRGEGLLDQYVNDRPYAASSFLSVALNKTLRTAMNGVCAVRPELAAAEIPLEAVVTPLPARGGEALVRQLFEPLGWTVTIEPVPGPDGEASRYVTLRLAGAARLSDLLSHLYVLIPVLDDDKHYWVGEDEVEKLMARGRGWLEGHPARELIVRRYLIHRRGLADAALARLAPEAAEPVVPGEGRSPEDVLEAPIKLNDLRLRAVVDALRETGASRIADLGCGEGRLLRQLVRERWVESLIGVDAGARDLEWAAKRLKLGLPGGPPEGRVTLLHSGLNYRDDRWAGVDAAALVEVIEHLDEDRLPALAQVVFGHARPGAVIVTTPNAEYNALFPNMKPGAMRHPDHRFEWTRAQFRAWIAGIEAAFGYSAAFADIGETHPELGAPTQMAVLTR